MYIIQFKPEIETARTTLKPFQPEDIQGLIELYSDPDIMKFLGGVRTQQQVEQELKHYIQQFQQSTLGSLAIFLKTSGEFIGRTGLRYSPLAITLEVFKSNGDSQKIPLQQLAQLGYVLDSRWHRQGFATEVSQAVIQWGFKLNKLQKIVALIHPDNYGSVRIARDKCHMQLNCCFVWKDGLPWQLYSLDRS